MKNLMSNLRTPKSEAGSSLVEVIVASMIMAIIGLALVTVTVGAKPLAERFNGKSIALSSLTFAAKQIQLQPIQDINCTGSVSDKVQPYYFGSNSTKGGKGFVVSIVKDFYPALTTGLNYVYTATPATMPTGLSLNSATGEITGTPTTESSTKFTIVATSGLKVSKQIINISVITVVIKIDVASAVNTTDFKGCATNAAGVSTATAAYTEKQIIQQVVLTTTTDTTQTSRTIVKMG